MDSLTVAELKNILKSKGLPIGGSKADLQERLRASGLADEDVRALLCENTDDTQNGAADIGAAAISLQKEVELMRRERELLEREFAVAQQEIEMLRRAQAEVRSGSQGDPGNRAQQREEPASNVPASGVAATKLSVATIADLLSYFNGSSENFETWQKQVVFLKTAYKLEDNMTKILIGMRLKGKALEWFHSKPEFIEMKADELLTALKGMFYHRPNKIVLRRKFEERVWRKTESFHDYVHEKVILANRISVSDDDVVGYIVEGIPDPNLRDLARVHGFTSRESLLAAFEEITLQDRDGSLASGGGGGAKFNNKSDGGKRKADKREKDAKGVAGEEKDTSVTKKPEVTKRCFNCGKRDHISAACPEKDKGPKCFECREYGHIATNCPKKQVNANCVTARSTSKKHGVDVKINDIPVSAILDTGSDLTIMRADEYIKIGAPKLINKKVPFRGVGTEANTTLGEFDATITVDGNAYPILIRVISDCLSRHKLLVGRDFLDTVDLSVKRGVAKISPAHDDPVGSEVPEVYQIDVFAESEVKSVDLSLVSDVNHRAAVQDLIGNYNPIRTREVGVEMKLILKDDEPVYQRARRLSIPERDDVNAQIQQWIDDGIVRPSVSDYASPIVLVKKRDGTNRICVDYRMLNKKIIKDRYPLPLIEDQLDKLQNAKKFSTLDLKNGFFHVKVNEQSRKFTAFIVPDGHYEFMRVPFGLCNSPAIFQRFVNAAFKDLIRDGVILVYMDDLIIPLADCESGLKNLKLVLDTASLVGLCRNWDKCSFLQSRVEFLGHIIENNQDDVRS
ncbi:PREDICTED: uncharacterized protein K02A2.6-like [Vollenhovia emeryi]|uniref:uncharacterized protein K02A2.6-like n=1 Tax=Vollenhovia emeryi TaxID=411798 RepID=UPI0005F40C2B|nr:PREDICTED: uncharacterized protein K02A2.6-like [Vollenhovia emeryi]